MTEVITTTTTTDPREFGHIYARAGSPYLWVRYRVNGHEYRESAKSADRRKAEKLLLQRQVELGVPGAFTPPDVRATTFEDLQEFIEAKYRAKGFRSTRRLGQLLGHLGQFFAGMRAQAITADRLTAYLADRLDEGAAPATVRLELNVLGTAFRLARKFKRVTEVPEFPPAPAPVVRTGFFERDEFEAVLAHLPAHLRPPLEFAYMTGWRVPSEVLPLTWDRVDFDAGVVRLEVGSTKNREGRTFPFAALPELTALLERRRVATDAVQRQVGRIVPHVFWRVDGTPIKDFRKTWHGACRRAAFAGTGPVRQLVRPQLLERIPHDLRRTAVRNLVRAGVPEKTAMLLTGHKTRTVFDRYNIVNEADLSAGVAKLAVLRGTRGAQSPAAAAGM